ncbi:mitochondrial carrier domain-containing protein [Suillus spraguei]|nr:mitochondrial carrier domain-containing protein [Suillus spraguei]
MRLGSLLLYYEFYGMIFLVLLALVLTILVPLAGASVRIRAHYDPKGLQLDSEGSIGSSPVIPSFFSMLRRIHRIEGWSGLYKGLLPTSLSIRVVAALVIFLRNKKYLPRKFLTPGASTVWILVCSILLPQAVIKNRAITTPYKLPGNIYSLRVLLTPTERWRPLTLYLTPGLLIADVAWQVAYAVLIPRWIRRLLLRAFVKPGIRYIERTSTIKLVIVFVAIALLKTIIITPLEVIFLRLSIQPNRVAPEFNSISQEESDTEEAREYAGVEEDVINLRTEREPYVGLIDCGKRIIEEEGWGALYRVWWWTTLQDLCFSMFWLRYT